MNKTAIEWGADLYVSLHTNATGGSGWKDEVRGWTAWIYQFGGDSERAARDLLTETKAAGIHTFGVEIFRDNFTVISCTTMPAVLIEYLFHTSRADVALLKDSDYHDRLAVATAKGICRYFGVAYEAPKAEVLPEWAQKAADWAIANGIAKGVGDRDGDGQMDYDWWALSPFIRQVALLYQYHLSQTRDGMGEK